MRCLYEAFIRRIFGSNCKQRYYMALKHHALTLKDFAEDLKVKL
jgi:hypothetical protein